MACRRAASMEPLAKIGRPNYCASAAVVCLMMFSPSGECVSFPGTFGGSGLSDAEVLTSTGVHSSNK